MATEACLVCGGTLVPAVATPRSSYGQPGKYRIDACPDCGAGATIPRPTADELSACYEANYGYSAHDLIEPEKRRRSRSLLSWSGVRSGNVLDVGCMFGFLLDEARALGVGTYGIELSAEPARIAEQKGHDVFVGTIEQFAAGRPDLRFSAIFAQHVLEHVVEPRSFLQTARGLLEPGGKLVVCVPNFGARLRKLAPSSWAWYQVPVHLHHFSETALQRLLTEVGLEPIAQRTSGGDSLFVVLSALQALGLSAPNPGEDNRSRLTRPALRMVGEILRPYYAFGDDELAMIARS
ncbi:MAG: class I SAM-dependent methyltransferase [Kofleriaceae bacterium]